jgi:electron transport complex protein RnfG
MPKRKNNYIQYAATLAIICLAASGLLSVVHNFTEPKILAQKAKEESSSLEEVYPEAREFKPVKENGEIIFYHALDKKGKVLGYCFKAEKPGYSSVIVTMVGMKRDGVIRRIKILSQNETPGLGAKICEVVQKETLWDVLLRKTRAGQRPRPWFQEMFNEQKITDLQDSVDTITGATISSRAVIESIQEKAKEILKKASYDR